MARRAKITVPERKTLYLYRHTYSGRSEVVRCMTSLMTPEDIDEAEKFHRRITRGLSRDIFVPTGKPDLDRLLGDEGIALGIWFEKKLICMRAIVTGEDWMNEILIKMGHEPDDDNKTAFTEHCIVDREFRGNNMQFLTHYRLENYLAERFDRILTTVAPVNVFSLDNIFACNFVVTGLKELYGGHLRYIMEKDYVSAVPIWTHGHLVIPRSNVEMQQQVLAQGYVGYKMIRKNRGFSILYAPSSQEKPRTLKSKKD